MTTHNSECYKWHHACAIAEVERLRSAFEKPAAWMMVNNTYATACERKLRWTPAKDWHETWKAVPLFAVKVEVLE